MVKSNINVSINDLKEACKDFHGRKTKWRSGPKVEPRNTNRGLGLGNTNLRFDPVNTN